MTKEAKSSVQREAPVDMGEGLVTDLNAIETQVGAVTRALAKSRKIRLGVFVGFLVMVGLILYSFYNLADQFRSEENIKKLSGLAQAHLDENADRYVGQVRQLVDESVPVLKDAFLEQAKKDTPKYEAALKQQRDELVSNLSTSLEQQVSDHYQSILKRHEGILKEEFPDLDDEQLGRVALNFEKAARQLVEKYYVDRMAIELEGIYDTWDQFPMAEKPGPNDLPLEDQLVGCLMEVATMKLTAEDQGSILDTN